MVEYQFFQVLLATKCGILRNNEMVHSIATQSGNFSRTMIAALTMEMVFFRYRTLELLLTTDSGIFPVSITRLILTIQSGSFSTVNFWAAFLIINK